jgi:hypothetical protein
VGGAIALDISAAMLRRCAARKQTDLLHHLEEANGGSGEKRTHSEPCSSGLTNVEAQLLARKGQLREKSSFIMSPNRFSERLLP